MKTAELEKINKGQKGRIIMNPMALMKVMSAKNKFTANHPKFVAFLGTVLKGGIEEGTVIEISVQKPGEEKITSNLKVTQSDLELFNELKDLA